MIQLIPFALLHMSKLQRMQPFLLFFPRRNLSLEGVTISAVSFWGAVQGEIRMDATVF